MNKNEFKTKILIHKLKIRIIKPEIQVVKRNTFTKKFSKLTHNNVNKHILI